MIPLPGKLSKLVCVRCHTCPADDSFKCGRFEPSKSNVRVSWFTGIEAQGLFQSVTIRPVFSGRPTVIRKLACVFSSTLKVLRQVHLSFANVLKVVRCC